MDHTDFMDFTAFYGYIIRLYQQSEYALALDIATRQHSRFPDQAPLIYHVRACLASCLNDQAQAMSLLREAVEAGYWYPDYFWEDNDFTPIKELPEFQQLKAISAQRRASAQANVKPELLVETPNGAASPYPLLMALHGNTHNAKRDIEHWRAALAEGWLLAAPQATQIVGIDMYVWDDRDQSERDIQAHYAALCEQYPIDTARVVIGGFSMGGETAIYLALKSAIPVCGFIAVAPGGPFTQELKHWKPVLEAARGRSVRGYIIIGTEDLAFKNVLSLAELLRDNGISCEQVTYPDMGHDIPPDFDQNLPYILDFILGS